MRCVGSLKIRVNGVWGKEGRKKTRVFEVRVDEAVHLIRVDGYWRRSHDWLLQLCTFCPSYTRTLDTSLNLPFPGSRTGPQTRFPGLPLRGRVAASVSRIISSVQYAMSHNGDSREERDGDERPETVSIGELLRSAHEISHRSIRHLPV